LRRAWGKKRTDGYRSGFEAQIAAGLTAAGVPFTYESLSASLDKPLVGAKCYDCGSKKVGKKSSYKPDFVLPISGTTYQCIVEAKGRMTAKDRKTILAFSAVAMTSYRAFFYVQIQRDNFLSPGSKTRYSDWLTKNGITYAVGTVVPPEWYEATP
jgi:hypothetical protein